MKHLTLILVLLLVLISVPARAATSFTEFYLDTTGNNNNGGSDTNVAAKFTFTTGGWVSGTGVFTATGSDLSGISTNDWASVYSDGGTSGFSGQVTAVDDTLDTITVSLTAKWGSAPGTGAALTIKVGGALKGPNGAAVFPFNTVAATATNRSGNIPRFNFKAGTYSYSGGPNHGNAGPCRFQGMTSVPGDGGKATLASTGTASFVLLTVSGVNNDFADLIIDGTSFTSGTSDGISMSGAECTLTRVVVHDVRNTGCAITASGCVISECEAYLCNGAGSSGKAGFSTTGVTTTFDRCIAHDNAGSTTDGFNINGSANTMILNCVAETNGRNGVAGITTVAMTVIGSDFYNNSGNGINMTGASAAMLYIENCNFFKNTTNGINSTASSILNGAIVNCAFGAGTQSNTVDIASWITSSTGVNVTGSISYAAGATPWTAPTTGNFTILSTAAGRAAGRGGFTQTQASYTGTVGYPDIGAAQSITNSSTSGGSYTFGQ